MTPMGHLMEVRNIETYYGPTMAIRGVSFDVTQGQIVTIFWARTGQARRPF